MNIEKVIEELQKVNPEWDGFYRYDDDNRTWLGLSDTNISDITPLNGMPLRMLNLNYTNVSDLTPLKGMPLELLWLDNTPAAKKPLPKWLDGVNVYGLKGK